MKYMGSKRSMLSNGLGQLICEQAKYARRIVDLFCGSASISWFASENTKLPVLSADLQLYSVILARAITGRTIPLDIEPIFTEWLQTTRNNLAESNYQSASINLNKYENDVGKLVDKARILCTKSLSIGPIWSAYGGYYFSPIQALTFDYLIKYLPKKEPFRTVATAAILHSAIKCVASPGHTAQPFQPTEGASKFLLEAWNREPIQLCQQALGILCPRHALTCGEAIVEDAINIANTLNEDDLVIIDPPYSEVQYSRFYHVLETIARHYCGPVSGTGRYPPISERPQSKFCNRSQSKIAFQRLIKALKKAKATLIVTFPSGECTNGLSGDFIKKVTQKSHVTQECVISGRFSTLGGNNKHRTSRKSSNELLLLLKPK